jgi:hypothetical protein
MAEDLGHGASQTVTRHAGIWPYAVLAAGIAVVAFTHRLAVY